MHTKNIFCGFFFHVVCLHAWGGTWGLVWWVVRMGVVLIPDKCDDICSHQPNYTSKYTHTYWHTYLLTIDYKIDDYKTLIHASCYCIKRWPKFRNGMPTPSGLRCITKSESTLTHHTWFTLRIVLLIKTKRCNFFFQKKTNCDAHSEF